MPNARAARLRRMVQEFHLRTSTIAAYLLLASLAPAGVAVAQQPSADELAKKLSNPVASLISVPFQYNFDYGYGSEDGSKNTLNVQPVIPASISDDWNLITRVILPVVYQDDVFGDSGSQFGLGDTTPTLFFSPKAPTAGGLIWGMGPVFLLPTATDDLLGGEKWGIGPSVVMLKQTPAGLTYGVLANHIWSVAGDDDRADISNTFLQPFVSKALGKGRTITLNTESSYNWEDSQWTVPLNLQYTVVKRWGKQLVSIGGGGRVFLETPDGGPDWGLRLIVTLLYPR